MVRAPCCEKMGLKKGPWTSVEDQILVNYIQIYGHGNWRALPRLAGLLRCGKSCRLRWTNYLRPDIKRGNFSREEEETIIKLHQMLGNRWSAIAARLPGRTDNEIKNVWHTHLKKRVQQSSEEIKMSTSKLDYALQDEQLVHNLKPETDSITVNSNDDNNNTQIGFSDNSSETDENFWLEVLSADDSGIVADPEPFGFGSKVHDSTEFWFNVFTGAGELEEFLEMM